MADGEDINNEGTQANEEQEETHDWTDVIELHNKSKLKPYSIEELATSSVPHTIPYLEVYRTDELYYEEYESPFLSVSSSSDTSSDSESGTDEEGSSSSGDGSSSGGTTGGNGNTPRYSSQTKNSRLRNELQSVVNKYYKKQANHTTLVNRYMNCKNNKIVIAGITAWSNKWLKSRNNVKQLNTSVYNIKRKYS